MGAGQTVLIKRVTAKRHPVRGRRACKKKGGRVEWETKRGAGTSIHRNGKEGDSRRPSRMPQLPEKLLKDSSLIRRRKQKSKRSPLREARNQNTS